MDSKNVETSNMVKDRLDSDIISVGICRDGVHLANLDIPYYMLRTNDEKDIGKLINLFLERNSKNVDDIVKEGKKRHGLRI